MKIAVAIKTFIYYSHEANKTAVKYVYQAQNEENRILLPIGLSRVHFDT